MKKAYWIAVLLTALLLVPLFQGNAENAFTVDQENVYQGMNRSWQQGYEPSIANNRLTLMLPLLSEQAYELIETELIVADEALSPFKPQSMKVKNQCSESGAYIVRLPLELYADRTNGDYRCVIRVTGQTASGEPLSMEMPYTLRIRDGQPGREVMRAQITDVLTDLKVGEAGWVSVVLTNPRKTVAFEHLVLKISDQSGEILPQHADVLYLEPLAPGESVTVTFPLTVLSRASVAHHILEFSLSWLSLGQPVTQTEHYTVPVTQEMRLEQGGVKMASSVIAGDSIAITLPLMNMGRSELVNVLASVSLPGITDKQSVLVGTIPPGKTKNAQIMITPGKHVVDDFSGTLDVEATDNDGNPTGLSLPIALTLEEPVVQTQVVAPVQKEDDVPYLVVGLAGGVSCCWSSAYCRALCCAGRYGGWRRSGCEKSRRGHVHPPLNAEAPESRNMILGLLFTL